MQDFFEKHNKGIVGTTIFHAIVALIIIFLGFSTPLPLPGEEGIIINFGTDDDGFGYSQPQRQETAPPPPPPASVNQPEAEEEIITQDIEEAPSLPVTQPQETRQPEPAPPVEQPRQEPAQEVAQEEAQEEVAEQVPERRPNPNALFPGRTTSADTGTSEGETTGAGDQGRVTGSADSPHREGGDTGSPDGVSFSLAGRNAQSLPLPEYQSQVEGIVVVEVTVNRNGDVTSAVPGVRGSTTMNDYLLNTARRAAEKAKFNIRPDAPAFQRGTITYHFKLQ